MTDAIDKRMKMSVALRISLVSVLVLALAFPVFPKTASADVRKADLVMGESVETRGLSVSQCPDVDAAFVAVMSQDGTVYFERDADTATKIASITKVMTAIVALDSVPESTQVVVTDTAVAVGESSAALESGDTLQLTEALKALLVPSGNDAAEAIAEAVGKLMLQSKGQDSSDDAACSQAFVDAMNAKASELGLEDTVFANPHGLDDDGFQGNHHSTAADVARIAQYAMQKPIIREIVGGGDTVCTANRAGQSVTLSLESTDELLGEYDGICGIKTGFTMLAGACFAGACNRGDGDLYAIVLNSTDTSQRFVDTETLFDWVYEHSKSYSFINCARSVVTTSGDSVPLVAEVAQSDWVNTTVQATVSNPSLAAKVFDLNGNVSQSVEYRTLSGDVHAGDVVGKITFKQRNTVIDSVDLVATEDLAAPNILEGIGVWWDRFVRGFQGDDGIAESVCYNQTPLINDKTQTVN